MPNRSRFYGNISFNFKLKRGVIVLDYPCNNSQFSFSIIIMSIFLTITKRPSPRCLASSSTINKFACRAAITGRQGKFGTP